MNSIHLTSTQQVDELTKSSFEKPVIIYKHSTRCAISSMALSRLERAGDYEGADFYYLDLIANRSVSNYVAEKFHVQHESPQILILKNGECVYDESHNGIRPDEIREQIAAS